MSTQGTKLLCVETGQWVPAQLCDCLGVLDMLDAEEQWAPWRIRVLRKFMESGIEQESWPEHCHWNWAKKAKELKKLDIDNPLSPYRIMGVKHEDQWQGIILVTSVGHGTRLGRKGRSLLYVEFLETAPWNLSISDVRQAPRFRGVR